MIRTAIATDRSGAIASLGIVSTLVYAAATFGLGWESRRGDVLGFLGVMALLFALYAIAARLLWHVGPSAQGRVLGIVLLGAVAFRLAFVLIGLPADRPWDALREDLGGETLGAQPFLAYDNDVWRYLWDGHLVGAGLSPYRVTPVAVGVDGRLVPGARERLGTVALLDLAGPEDLRPTGGAAPAEPGELGELGEPGGDPAGVTSAEGVRPGSVVLLSSGPLARTLGAQARIELDLPATLRDVLEAACAAHPEARDQLFSGAEPLPAVYRAERRVRPSDLVRDGDRLDLILVVSGG